MERTMSVEDKIRRAEEIYSRRHQKDSKITNTRVSVENTGQVNNPNINKKLKKMIIQIVVCMLIYLTFYYIIKNDYIFSKDFKNKCEEILSYDISFSEMYKNISDYILLMQEKYKNIQLNNQEQNQEEKQEEINEENSESIENEEQNNIEDSNSENQDINSQVENIQEEVNTNIEENIGGADENLNSQDIGETKELSQEEQMKKDAEEVKSKISFIKPLTGTITSVFGDRNPKSSTVSKYHTGIDIAANEGTNIISATSGIVELASSEGAYGNHLKIVIDDVTIIYAHCLRLEVSQGDTINQGQIIAKVGSTGNSTGPHLHFEIRKEDRYVDPSLILDF